VLAHFNHLSKLALFLIQACILLLFLTQFRGGVKKELEVLRIATALEEVDLGQQLFFLLLKLSDLLFKLSGVHALLSEGLSVRVHGLELRLKVLVDLKSVAHIIIVHKLIRDLKWYEELCSVCFSLQVLQATE
jgi:hypothetical protein